MNRFLLLAYFLFSYTQLYAQSIPELSVDDSLKIRLEKLTIESKLVGNYLTTTYDFSFFNERNEILEGELSFPLIEGESIVNFGMELNGQIRWAAIVEKQKARVAYEHTIMQRIDPAILEKTQGNNYKARVYPINPNSYKRIVIITEQMAKQNSSGFIIPFRFENTDLIKEFTFSFSTDENHQFQSTVNGETKTHDSHYSIQGNNEEFGEVTITKSVSENDASIKTFNQFFHAYVPIKGEQRKRNLPQSISLLWDASFSMRNRNIDSELRFLEEYFQKNNTVKVQLIICYVNSDKEYVFDIEKGEWAKLKSNLLDVVYDGSTSLSNVLNKHYASDEVWLFSDGLTKEDKVLYNQNKLYTFNSVKTADYDFLKQLSQQSGGRFVDLLFGSTDEAFKRVYEEPLMFLGVEHDNPLTELYPNKIEPIHNQFSISGKFEKPTKLVLLFGYGQEVTDRKVIQVKRNQDDNVVQRLWAKQKLADLLIEDDREKVVTHCTKYQLISDYTSMIVLDRVEDYVEYEIEPPKELRAEYKQLLSQKKESENERNLAIEDRLEYIADEIESLKEWYKDPIQKKKKRTTNVGAPQQNSTTNQRNRENQNTTNSSAQNRTQFHLDSTKNIISGQILDESGEPVIAATIRNTKTNNATLTDIEGFYSLNADLGDVISVSYVGMESSEHEVGGNNMNIELRYDESAIDDVVVMGYSAQETRHTVTTIPADFAGELRGLSISQSITQEQTNKAENPELLSLRPLYILDGVIYEGEFSDIPTEEIESINIMDEDAGIALCGSQASGGLIIITTKNISVENAEKIKELNQLIEEKVSLKEWSPDLLSSEQMDEKRGRENSYNHYLKLRSDYQNMPSFYLEMANLFIEKGYDDLALLVISNLAEIDIDNYELYRALAYKLEAMEQHEMALYAYKKVAKLRPEEIQSYRDLALAYEAVGKYQESFDLLSKIVNGDYSELDEDELYEGIEAVSFIELSHLVAMHYKELKNGKMLKRKYPNLELDLRVVLDWNFNDTDLDLHVSDPNGETANYKNQRTQIGALLSSDMLDGYGPEEFKLKNAISGSYEIMVDYFADNVQKIAGPPIVKVSVFKYYGTKDETKEVRIVSLEEEEGELILRVIEF